MSLDLIYKHKFYKSAPYSIKHYQENNLGIFKDVKVQDRYYLT